MIDPHVHLRDWNQSDKETVEHGINQALSAGIDCLFDMPNTDPPILHRDEVIKRLKLGEKVCEKSKTYYHLYIGLTFDKDQIKQAVELYNEFFPRVIGLKMFVSNSTGNMGILNLENQKEMYCILKALNYTGVLAVHCENESFFNLNEYNNSLKRPSKAEVDAVRNQIKFAKETGFKGNLHICHISTPEALNLVKAARKKIKITCGITAHHALFNMEGENRNLRMNPPLRSRVEQEKMLEELEKGTIDWVESDHAPHTIVDKSKGACGIAGFANILRLVKELKKFCGDDQLKALFGENVKKTFKIEDKVNYDFSLENIDQRIKNLDDQYKVDIIKY
ncbi:MAG: dihydroorotase [Sphaerochaetaceae bacterium]|nr:amidohydrolase family protein [Sphaerochaetaceae bacterium]